MNKKIIKILSTILLVIVLIILYFSIIGVKTKRFNENITSRILEINKKINLDLKDVKFLLNPYNFTVNITTKDPTILFENNKLKVKNIKTTIFLKSLLSNEFSVDYLQISTKSIKLKNVISLAKSFKNSAELLILDKIIEDGFLTADINLKFDDEGKIKEDYKINGFIKNTNFNFLDQHNINNLNFEFSVNKKKYLFTDIKADFNDIKLSSPLVEANKKEELFLIKGKILTKGKEFNTKQLSTLIGSLIKNIDIKKARFSSINNFSFNINKKLKFNNLNVDSKVNLDQLIINNNLTNLKSYLPNLNEEINFENHKIIISYKKDKFNIKGSGEILIEDKADSINYQIIKSNNQFLFNTKANIKNSDLLINFLDYKKNKNIDASILINGNFIKNNSIEFNLISLVEKNNKISFKNLNFNSDFKIMNIDSFNFNYINDKKIKNQLLMKKNNLNYIIEGKSYDATKLINTILNNENGSASLFSNFNSKINLKIDKIYIDEIYFMNDLSGTLNFVNNEINNLNLESVFPNNKKINLSIKTNDKREKITKLSTNYPKPLIKRYDFIKGFDEGYLDFNSVKKNGISNSLLVIDNFKVKEVPVFAKLLSLASLQGIADLLTGEGIRFTDFEMKFSNKKGLTTIEEMYAIGPAVSILMDGYIESKKIVSLRGTLVPATTINRSIASIPLLGNILVGKKVGEGIFGVSFKIKGSPKNLKTSVNPVKTLTPRFITRTLEKIKKN